MRTPVILTLVASAFAAPLINAQRDNVVPGKYIVKFKDDVHILAYDALMASISADIDFKYSLPGFLGFASALSDKEVADTRRSKLVEYVEEDTQVHASTLVEQPNATWDLARISHSQPKATSYIFDDSAGEGTCAYVIDTGIYTEHPEFEGRAKFLTDTSGENLFEDGSGHGTHVAGTIGSITWGVAKKTRLFAVKVLDSDGSGTTAGVIAGIQYVNDDAKNRTRECAKGIVSNMSLGGSRSKSLNQACAALVSSGVFLAVAAGNEGSNANTTSPASEPTVCTVAATSIEDNFPKWSNWGPIVDILAPGANITSTWNDGGIKTISGTSMAAPHIAGLAAYLLGLGDAKAKCLCKSIADLATVDAINSTSLPRDTPNLLAYNGAKSNKGLP